jgi:hypothetical protein
MDPITGAFTLSPFYLAIKALYGIAEETNKFINSHIESMKESDNKTIAKVGTVLERAKYGFGLGYMSSMVIMVAGQLLLGNSLAAVSTAVAITNPIAMTCGAVGAIYYGWTALSEDERSRILKRIEDGLKIGIETVRSVLEYVIKAFKEFGDSKVYAELKKLVGESAKIFGRSLSDVTRKITDRISDAKEVIGGVTTSIFDKASEASGLIMDVAHETGSSIADVAKKGMEETKKKITGSRMR